MHDDGIGWAVLGALVLGCFIGFAAGVRTDVNYTKLRDAQSLCEANGGLLSLDNWAATCDNGAEFRLSAQD